MVESMVEKVARAIEDEGPVGCCTISPEKAMSLARAAIEAMREPTDAMIMAAEWAEPEYREDDMDMAIQFKAEWRAAIDTALLEQVSG